MKKLLGLVVLLLIMALGLSFAVLNPDAVRLNYYLGALDAPLSLIVVVAVAMGAVLGALSCVGILWGSRREAARLRRKMNLTERELRNLRELPVRDRH